MLGHVPRLRLSSSSSSLRHETKLERERERREREISGWIASVSSEIRNVGSRAALIGGCRYCRIISLSPTSSSPPPFSRGRNIIKASTNTHTGGWNDLIPRDFLPNEIKRENTKKENDDDLIPSGMYGPIYHIPWLEKISTFFLPSHLSFFLLFFGFCVQPTTISCDWRDIPENRATTTVVFRVDFTITNYRFISLIITQD